MNDLQYAVILLFFGLMCVAFVTLWVRVTDKLKEEKTNTAQWITLTDNLAKQVEALQIKVNALDVSLVSYAQALEYLSGEVAADYPTAVKVAQEIATGKHHAPPFAH